jgi:hypothetical protein
VVNVHFVAPFCRPSTLRFLEAVTTLPGVRVGLVSQQPLEAVPEGLRARLAGHWRVADALDPEGVVEGSRGLARQMGSADRLLGVLEQLQEPLAAAREALGVEGMGSAAARNFRDKAQMKTLLRAAGLPCARYALATDGEAARSVAAALGFPLVVKPPAGAGARATFRLDDGHQLALALAALPPSAADPWLLEERITGEEHSFDTISIRGRPVWHSLTRYLPTPLEVLENPWIQWCVVLPREVDDPCYDSVRAAAFRALEVLGMDTGISHLEWFRRPDGAIALSEVAARPPGAQITTLMAFAHDFDFHHAWARLMVFEQFTAPSRRYAAGAAFLRGQGQGRVRALHGLEAAQRAVGHLVVEARLPRPGQPRADGYEGEGHVIVRHPETAVVTEALARLVGTLRVELA